MMLLGRQTKQRIRFSGAPRTPLGALTCLGGFAFSDAVASNKVGHIISGVFMATNTLQVVCIVALAPAAPFSPETLAAMAHHGAP